MRPVTGLITIRGRHYDPQDLERTAEETMSLVCPGCVVAFSTDVDGGERVVIAAEVHSRLEDAEQDVAPGHAGLDYARIRSAVAHSLAERHDLHLHDLVLLESGTIPKTSGGTVRRGECQRQYLASELRRHDQGGIGAGLQYQLRAELRFTGRQKAPHPRARRFDEKEYRNLLHEFLEPALPTHVATLVSRDADEYRSTLRRIRHFIDIGVLEVVRNDVGPPGRLGATRLLRPQSKELYFAYAALWAGMMMPPIEFFTHTGLIKRNVVMFRDRLTDNYLSGISLEVPTLEALLAYQRGVMDSIPQLRATHTVGTSMGAFGAILAAHALALDTAWAFALPAVRYTSKRRGDVTCDLPELLRRSNGVTKYHIYYKAGHENDARCAGELEGLPGVRLHPMPGSDHQVVKTLWREGTLATIFPVGPEDDAPPPSPSTTRAGDFHIEQILEIVRKTVYTPVASDWTPTSPLGDYLDSFGTMHLLAELERDLCLTVPLGGLRAHDLQTPATLTEFLRTHAHR